METQAVTPIMATNILTRSRLLYAGVFVTLLFTAFIFFYKLADYPIPSFDEGSYMKVAKNYVVNGIYGDYSIEGNRYTGAVIATGPTLILPVAAVFKVFGFSIPLARIVVVIYSIAMLACFYLMNRNLLNARLAFIAFVLLILVPNIQYFTRNVRGEIPGLFFVFAGLWLWLRPGKRSLAGMVVVGVLFGLASMTKNQYAFFVLPSILLAFVLDLVWYKRRGWRDFVVPGMIAGVMFAAWNYYILMLLGAADRNVTEDLNILRQISSSTFFLINPEINLHNITHLLDGKFFGGLFIPAVLYGLYLSRKRDEVGQRWGILWIFLVMSVGFFVFSIGWDRYAVPHLALSTPFVAVLLYALTNGFRPDWNGLREMLRGREPSLSALVNLALTGLLIVMVALPAYDQFKRAAIPGKADVYRLAEYLNVNIPQDTVIETWEPELAIVTNHTYHFPPHIVMLHYNIERDLGNTPTERYDFHDWVDPDYVIVGPYGDASGIYTPQLLTGYSLIFEIGEFHVYGKQEVVSNS